MESYRVGLCPKIGHEGYYRPSEKDFRVATAHHAVFYSARVEMIRRKGIRPCPLSPYFDEILYF
jgi:hypothetical protein